MLNKWNQVESWIRDNNFARWIIYRSKPEDSEKSNNIIADSNFYNGDFEDKIAMTKKYLELNGGRGWAVGYAKANYTTNGGVICEIRLDEVAEGAPVSGVQQSITPFSVGEIEDRVRKQVMAEIRLADLDKREKAVAEREKALDEERQTALGAIVHYFAPIGQMLIEKKMMPRVAGLDADEPVHAQRIVAQDPQPEEIQEQEQEEEVFTDQEGEEIFDLMKRFKAIEPDNWLKMIRTVVEMAERKDPTYNMAKQFLIK